MELSDYHKKYAALPDEEIRKRISYKKEELAVLLNEIKLATAGETVDVAVIGCSDRRMVKLHQEIFFDFTARRVNLTTFDITIDHLAGESNVIQHDCVEPLPSGPYDITYGHVVLRFVHRDHQWDVIKNTVNALKPGGLAIHVLDFLDFTTESERLPNGLYSVPLRDYERQLTAEGLPFVEVTASKGLVLAIKKPLT
ncbi:MAG: hypothetical protein V1738_06655 [Patescibacteria group bacterium]